ncbi:MAG: ABC transporter ATP-binding protein [Nocardioidaceae bacterium]
MIEIVDLRKTFSSRGRSEAVPALDNLNLTINDHEFLTILGPSGCGKTTLLRLIDGLESWDEGDILIDGRAVRGPGPDRAMVFQGFALMPWASVLDNVAFGLELRGTPAAARKRKAAELIDMVGLSRFEQRYPMELSGGMQQRVGLARALAVEPEVLLMDEPFGALDEQTRRILQEELLRLWENHRITVVFVTHSMEEAVLLGDRVALIGPRPGRVEEILPVHLPRPRAHQVSSVVAAPEFAQVTAELWERLRGMQQPPRGEKGTNRATARQGAPR